MDYTINSYKKLRKLWKLSRKNASNEKPDATALEDEDKINKDGSRVYRLKFANSTKEEIDKKIEFHAHYTLEDFSYSEHSMKLLSALLDYLQKRYDVEIFLAPYYPAVFQKIQSNVPEALLVEQKIREMARTKNIRVIGSYNPETVHCTNEDFYDGAHAKDICIKKIFENAPASSQPQ